MKDHESKTIKDVIEAILLADEDGTAVEKSGRDPDPAPQERERRRTEGVVKRTKPHS